MKHDKWVMNLLLIALGMIGLAACDWANQFNDSPTDHIFREEEAHLTDDASSPFCDFSIDHSFLREENDSIAALINRSIQREWFGNDYASLAPEAAVDSFMHVYIRDYRKEVGPLYLAEKAKASSEEEIPAWYHQTYSLVTFIEEGHSGTINASANYFVDLAGAHPSQWSRWMNFDFVSGKHLTKEEVFLPSAKADIESILLERLIRLQAQLHPEEKVTSLEDLQLLGFLQYTNMYIPDNFLLGKNEVLFLFNRYDIAPYAAGETIIRLSYEEIGPYLKH